MVVYPAGPTAVYYKERKSQFPIEKPNSGLKESCQSNSREVSSVLRQIIHDGVDCPDVSFELVLVWKTKRKFNSLSRPRKGIVFIINSRCFYCGGKSGYS